MTTALADQPEPTPGIGHNAPPLAEALAEETAALLKRAAELQAAAGRAAVVDEETAQRAVLMVAKMVDHARTVEAARVARKEPYLEGGRTVDRHFDAILTPLVGPDWRSKKTIGGAAATVHQMVDAHRRKKEAEADKERQRLEDEARKARAAQAAAEAAQREAEAKAQQNRAEADRRIQEAEKAAQAANDTAAAEVAARQRAEADAARQTAEREEAERRIEAEVTARQAAAKADRFEREAAAVTAAAIDTGYGPKASSRKVFSVSITDLTAAIRHARKVDEASVRAAVQQIYDRQVRAGVRDLPGAEVKEDSATTYRK